MSAAEKDGLDKAVAFLQKREGIDKALKLIRYSARLAAAVSPETELRQRCLEFEKSVGVSRKAFRLGKFLQDVNALRHSKTTGYLAVLELVAYGSEGIYYFIEQLSWLIKAGALSKENEQELSKISAWAELLGYFANIWLNSVKVRNINRRLRVLTEKSSQQQKGASSSKGAASGSTAAMQTASQGPQQLHQGDHTGSEHLAQIGMLRAAKATCMLAIVQDVADALMATNDIRGGKDALLGHPATLALAGLVSGAVSFRKNWRSCK